MELKFYPFLDQEPPIEMDLLVSSDIMAARVKLVTETPRVKDVIELLKSCDHNGFPVVSHHPMHRPIITEPATISASRSVCPSACRASHTWLNDWPPPSPRARWALLTRVRWRRRPWRGRLWPSRRRLSPTRTKASFQPRLQLSHSRHSHTPSPAQHPAVASITTGRCKAAHDNGRCGRLPRPRLGPSAARPHTAQTTSHPATSPGLEHQPLPVQPARHAAAPRLTRHEAPVIS